MKKIIKIFCLVVVFITSSCSEKLDFNQFDNFVFEPVFTSDLTFFTLRQSQFFDGNGNEQASIADDFRFEVFENQFLRENVVKFDFYTEIKNEFDRNVNIQIEFLNANNTVVYALNQMQIAANNVNYTFFEEINIRQNPILLTTTILRITAEIQSNGTPINANDNSEFELKSSLTFYIEKEL